MIPFHRLPVELYQPIFAHITDRRDFLSLVLASKILNQEAQPFFYRNLDPTLQPHPRSQELLLDRLSNSPRLAGYVHSLTLTSTILSSTKKALQALRNLKILRIHSNASARISQFIDKPPFQLHSLSCSFHFDDDFRVFIRAQPRISTLILIGEERLPTDYISQEDLPSLRVLSSSPWAIRDLLPRSNITHLNCDGNSWLMKYHLSRTLVANSLYSFKGVDYEFLDLYSSMFPNLRFLETSIHVGNHVDVLHRLVPSFSLFQHLEKLKMRYSQYPDADRETCSTFTTSLFSSSKTVATIEIFQNESSWKVSRGRIGTYSSTDLNFHIDEWMEWE